MQITIGAPKGSLEAGFENLMNRAGLNIKWDGYHGIVNDARIESVIKLRAQDSPIYVARGNLDIAVTGQDCVQELGLEKQVLEIAQLSFTRNHNDKVKLVLFVPEQSPIQSIADICDNMRIATEFPNIVSKYFQEKNIKIQIDVLHGACESVVRAGFVDAGIDIVDSGSTFSKNYLRPIETISASKTVLIANPESWINKKTIIQEIKNLLLIKRKSMFDLKFDENGLIPCVVQDIKTNQVLMVAYMNQESPRLTIETGETWFWSRTRQELWHKGATSGNIQKAREIYKNCEDNSLLILVEQIGNACHTGNKTCFYRLLKRIK